MQRAIFVQLPDLAGYYYKMLSGLQIRLTFYYNLVTSVLSAVSLNFYILSRRYASLGKAGKNIDPSKVDIFFYMQAFS